MSYTKEQCVERASEQPRPGYNLMSENEARELLRAHADALDEVERFKLLLAKAAAELPRCAGPVHERIKVYLKTYAEEIDALKAKLNTAEDSLVLADDHLSTIYPGGYEARDFLCRAVRDAITKIREAK